jgi:hypothetical protein
MRHSFLGAAIAAGLALALAAAMWRLPPAPPISGANTIAVAPQERLVLLAGNQLLLHDRAGVSVEGVSLDSLGLDTLAGPLAFDAGGDLLASGTRARTAAIDGPTPLLRCTPREQHCAPFAAALAGTTISALAVHPLDGSLFIADARAGELLKLDATGAILARASASVPAAPALRLDSGLLLMNSTLGPGISVFRYENDSFGEQLDEVLLLPPGEDDAYSGVRDFLWSGEHWWVLLERTGDTGAGLHRFDADWRYTDAPELAPGSRPTQLVNWGNRILVGDPSRLPIARFSRSGAAEVPLLSTSLEQLRNANERNANLLRLGWRIALALAVLATLLALCLGWLHRVRSLVYTSCRERGAEPVDVLADSIEWIEPVPQRAASWRNCWIGYAGLALALLLAAIGMGVSSLQLSALLLALLGPALALLLLQRSDPGHVGVAGDELLLVDHKGMYHLGGGGRIHWRGPFIILDDVAVFTGAALLPVFSLAGIAERVTPLAARGIKVDRRIVTVKLLEARHPLALGVLAILAALAAAGLLLSLQGIF